jgi:hypothetical protein
MAKIKRLVNLPSVIDRKKGKKISQEPEMRELRAVYDMMTDPERERTGSYLETEQAEEVEAMGRIYTCLVCGKMTRDTGKGESDFDFCAACYTMAGQEDAHSDDVHQGEFRDCLVCRESLRGVWNPNYKF